MDQRIVDVAVLGNGPAGCTVALELSKLGFSVALIGLPPSSKKFFGETLSPGIKASLIHLGVWKNFLADKHLSSSGNISSWGDEELKETNFIFHPDTNGWHLDRLKFDLMLLNTAIQKGAFYFESRIREINDKIDGFWNFRLQTTKNRKTDSITASFLVDATGRTGWFSSRRGIRRVVFDNLCGFVSYHLPKRSGDCDSMTLIEAAPDGWWYSALLPRNIRVTAEDYEANEVH